MNKIAYLVIGAILLSVGPAGAAEPSEDAGVASSTGAYFNSVTANGSGCPPGTWEASIASDGKRFTVTFSSYEVIVEPGNAGMVKDCTLSLNVHMPRGIWVSTANFSYQGYALMNQAGMSASQSARYYFRGAPVPAQSDRSRLSGPFDNTYVFSDRIALFRSSLGADGTLNANTRLDLRNNPPRTGSGYLNTNTVEGTID